MGATIKDIVSKTGLSLGTVSRYLNGHTIKPKNKQLIEEAIEELDYNVNLFARGLRTKKSYAVAFIVPSLGLKFFTEMIRTIEECMSEKGYFVSICVLSGDKEKDITKINNLKSQHIDGLFLVPPDDKEILNDIMVHFSKNIPIIIVDRYGDGFKNQLHVRVNNREVSKEAANSLIKKGYKNFGVISGNINISTAKDRLEGFLEALDENEILIKEENILQGDFSRKSGYVCAEELFKNKQKNKIDALFISNYDMTMGAVEYIQQSDVVNYGDIGIIGFDSDDISAILSPKLSMIVQPIAQMGSWIGKTMLKMIDDRNFVVESKEKVFKCKITNLD